jgi:hypothetical protein
MAYTLATFFVYGLILEAMASDGLLFYLAKVLRLTTHFPTLFNPLEINVPGWGLVIFALDYIIPAIVLIPSLSNTALFLYRLFFIEPDRALKDDQASLAHLLSFPVPGINHLPDISYSCPGLDPDEVAEEFAYHGINVWTPSYGAVIRGLRSKKAAEIKTDVTPIKSKGRR